MCRASIIVQVAQNPVARAFSLYLERIPAGFPSPAEDYLEKKLDLNNFLVQNPVATFMVRVSGDSMTSIGIHDSDVLNVHVFSSNYSLYGDMSTRVMAALDDFSPQIERYPIDEFFLWFSSIIPDELIGNPFKNERVFEYS